MEFFKMLYSVLLTLSVVLVSVVVTSGNVVPANDKITRNLWVPKSDQTNKPFATTIRQRDPLNLFPKYQPQIQQNVLYRNIASDGPILHRTSNEQRQQGGQDQNRLTNSENERNVSPLPEPKPRREDEDFQEKLGFGMLSSLLPTSLLNMPPDNAQTDNTDNNFIDSNSGSASYGNSAQTGDSSFPFGLPMQDNNGGENNFGFFQAITSSESSHEDSSSDSGVFSRIRNLLPFGKGFLSGFLNPENSNAEEDGNGDGNSGYGYEASISNNISSLFSSNPSQISLTNSEAQSDSEVESPSDSGESGGSSFLSSLPNPLRGIQNLLSTINLPQNDNTDQAETEMMGGYANGPSDPADSSITAFQSITDGGLGGTLGLFVPYLSHLVTVFGVAKAKLPLAKLLGAILGPILATAIAAMVIGIVYVSIYVAGNIVENAGVEGDMYLLSIKQLLNILGIPDPLEELFDINVFRSYKGRSLNSRLLSLPDQEMKLAIQNENDKCFERLLCHSIGTKLMSKESWRNGRLGTGIRWVSGNLTLETEDSIAEVLGKGVLQKYFRKGKSLVDAIAQGMVPGPGLIDVNALIDGNGKSPEKKPICARYTCNPMSLIKTVLKSAQKTLKMRKS